MNYRIYKEGDNFYAEFKQQSESEFRVITNGMVMKNNHLFDRIFNPKLDEPFPCGTEDEAMIMCENHNKKFKKQILRDFILE